MTARVEAERAIADVLLAHRVKSTDRGVAHCACGFTCWTTHENHLARLLADLMAERQAEAWDEGFNDGAHYASADLSHATYRTPPPTNPYQRASE